MAEVFGTIAAVIGVADVGAHISAKLYTFGVLVASADETISSISKEVALTSTVLKELGNILAKERPESPIITKIAIGNIEETVQECDKAFEQIDSLLLKRVPRLRLGKGNQGPKAAILLERFGWQALEPKVQLLRSNIDRLKSSLLLMLNVLMLAWLISERSGPQRVIRGKKILCEHLLDSKEAYDSKFKELENSRNHSFGTSRSTPINLTSNVLPTLFGNRGAHSPVTPDPYRRPSRTHLMSEPHQNAGLGVQSDQATLASYKINVLLKLQQDYNELFTSLVEEVRAQKYDINRESRSRIECQIGIARSNELSQLDLMASTTSAVQYSSDRQHGKAQEPSNSVSQTIVRDHDILQTTCVAPAQMVKSDRDDADQKSDASELIQRSQILEAQSVTSQDDSLVMTSSTWCLCPHTTAGKSTPESQQTSNTSFRESENHRDENKQAQQGDDSFYWNSGPSSSEVDRDHSQLGSPTATPRESIMESKSSGTTSTIVPLEHKALPTQSTSLSPVPPVPYGASALGFSGPSDWEYFGDYEAEDIDDEELYKHCKRSQGRGFSQPHHLAQHMRQVHSEVPVSDERDNQRIKRFLPNLPDYAKSDNTPSISASARPVACKVREHQSTLWTKISDPPTDSASQRARLGRYNTKNHTLPTFGGGFAGGRAAYEVAGVPRPKPPPKSDGPKLQNSESLALTHDASFNHNPDRNGDTRHCWRRGSSGVTAHDEKMASMTLKQSPYYRPEAWDEQKGEYTDIKGPSLIGALTESTALQQSITLNIPSTPLNFDAQSHATRSFSILGAPGARISSRSTPLADVTARIKTATDARSCHNQGGPVGRKPTIPDLLALWTTVRDNSEI